MDVCDRNGASKFLKFGHLWISGFLCQFLFAHSIQFCTLYLLFSLHKLDWHKNAAYATRVSITNFYPRAALELEQF